HLPRHRRAHLRPAANAREDPPRAPGQGAGRRQCLAVGVSPAGEALMRGPALLRRFGALALVLLVLAACAPARASSAADSPANSPAQSAPARAPDAQATADFYRGKTVRMVIAFPAGGGFDIVGRLVARYIDKYIPGNPTVIVENMPGAASML